MHDSSASYVFVQVINCFAAIYQHSYYAEQALNHCIHFRRAIASEFLHLLQDDQGHPPCHHLFEKIEHEHDEAVNFNQPSSFEPFFEAAFRLESICSEPWAAFEMDWDPRQTKRPQVFLFQMSASLTKISCLKHCWATRRRHLIVEPGDSLYLFWEACFHSWTGLQVIAWNRPRTKSLALNEVNWPVQQPSNIDFAQSYGRFVGERPASFACLSWCLLHLEAGISEWLALNCLASLLNYCYYW